MIGLKNVRNKKCHPLDESIKNILNLLPEMGVNLSIKP